MHGGLPEGYQAGMSSVMACVAAHASCVRRDRGIVGAIESFVEPTHGAMAIRDGT